MRIITICKLFSMKSNDRIKGREITGEKKPGLSGAWHKVGYQRTDSVGLDGA